MIIKIRNLFFFKRNQKSMSIFENWLQAYQGHYVDITLPHKIPVNYEGDTDRFEKFEILKNRVSIFTNEKKIIHFYGEINCEIYYDNEYYNSIKVTNFLRLELWWYYPNDLEKNRLMKRWTFYDGMVNFDAHKSKTLKEHIKI